MTCYDQNLFCDQGIVLFFIQLFTNSKSSHLVVNLVHALSSPIGHISRWHGFPQHNCFRTVRLDRSAFYCQRTPRAPSKRYSAVSTAEHPSILRRVFLTYGHPDLMMSFNHQAATTHQITEIVLHFVKQTKQFFRNSHLICIIHFYQCFVKEFDKWYLYQRSHAFLRYT